MIFFTVLILSELPTEDPPNFRTFIKDCLKNQGAKIIKNRDIDEFSIIIKISGHLVNFVKIKIQIS